MHTGCCPWQPKISAADKNIQEHCMAIQFGPKIELSSFVKIKMLKIYILLYPIFVLYFHVISVVSVWNSITMCSTFGNIVVVEQPLSVQI